MFYVLSHVCPDTLVLLIHLSLPNTDAHYSDTAVGVLQQCTAATELSALGIELK